MIESGPQPAARSNRIIALSLLGSAVLMLALGLAFVFALDNKLVGWILVLMGAVDAGLAWFFARRAME